MQILAQDTSSQAMEAGWCFAFLNFIKYDILEANKQLGSSIEEEVEGENEAEDDALGDENGDEEAPSDDGEVKGDQVGEDERGQRDLAHEESETSSFPGVEH